LQLELARDAGGRKLEVRCDRLRMQVGGSRRAMLNLIYK